MTALALVAAYPNDVTILVAHGPPLIPVLPDAAAAERARAGVRDAYQANGSDAGMAAFIAMTTWRGQFTDDYFAQPAPDPAQFGMSTDEDGSRGDLLRSVHRVMAAREVWRRVTVFASDGSALRHWTLGGCGAPMERVTA